MNLALDFTRPLEFTKLITIHAVAMAHHTPTRPYARARLCKPFRLAGGIPELSRTVRRPPHTTRPLPGSSAPPTSRATPCGARIRRSLRFRSAERALRKNPPPPPPGCPSSLPGRPPHARPCRRVVIMSWAGRAAGAGCRPLRATARERAGPRHRPRRPRRRRPRRRRAGGAGRRTA